jgi:hypothetical protein
MLSRPSSRPGKIKNGGGEGTMIKVRNLDTKEPEKVESKAASPASYISPANTQSIPDIDEIHKQAKLAATFGAIVTITGAWVWAGFKTIPGQAVRDELKANKWIWCRGKGKWAYRGKPCHSKKNMSWDYITNKYGEEKIQEEN